MMDVPEISASAIRMSRMCWFRKSMLFIRWANNPWLTSNAIRMKKQCLSFMVSFFSRFGLHPVLLFPRIPYKGEKGEFCFSLREKKSKKMQKS
jgi:hypothetical protein